jgi:uncharacterized membrane protein YciS (DUF1049 family)
VEEGVPRMSPTNYLTGSLLVVQCAVVSGRILIGAHNHGAVALAWLSATAFFLCSALAALCFRRAI